MTPVLFTLAVGCWLVVSAAPPAHHNVFPSPEQQQKYLIDFADEPSSSYYNQILHKQDYQSSPTQYQSGSSQPGAPSRLETFEDPNNQVELIQPQQTPQQQNPAAPNVPGIAPGQRVYIIHMPVPGYRPGTVGGYQPVYVVAAAPGGNSNTQGNVPGYQNTIYQDASLIPVIGSRFGLTNVPQPGYAGAPQQGGFIQQPGYSGAPQGYNGAPQQGFLIGGVGPQGSQGLFVGGAPYNLYQEPLIYQPVSVQVPQRGNVGSVRLNQYVGLQSVAPQPGPAPQQQQARLQQQNAESKQSEATDSEDSKESSEARPRPARPSPPAAASRTKP